MGIGTDLKHQNDSPPSGSGAHFVVTRSLPFGRRHLLALVLTSAAMVLSIDLVLPGQGMVWADKGSGGSGSDDGDSGGGGSGSDDSGGDNSGSGRSGSDDSGNDDSGSDDSGNDNSGSDDSGSDDSGSDDSGSGSGSSGSGSSGSGNSGSGSDTSGSGSGAKGARQPDAAGGSGRGDDGEGGFYQIQFLDGHFEQIQNGTFLRTNQSGRTVEQRPASRRDLARLNGYRNGPAGTVQSVIVLAPSRNEAEVRDDAGWIEIVQKGTYRLTDPNGNLVTRRKATGDDLARIRAMAGLG